MRNIKKGYEKKPTALKKIWWFLVKSDSLASWLVDLLLLWLFIKFLFIPLLGVILATPSPPVIVRSSSMEHISDFEQWWGEREQLYASYNISKEDFVHFKFFNGIDRGDIIIVKGYKGSKPKIGDVIVFDAKQPLPIIHRVIAIHNYTYETLGDKNFAQFPFEKNISEEQILGRAVARIPKIGWAKLIFVLPFEKLK